jgi:hypothetical protein
MTVPFCMVASPPSPPGATAAIRSCPESWYNWAEGKQNVAGDPACLVSS